MIPSRLVAGIAGLALLTLACATPGPDVKTLSATIFRTPSPLLSRDEGRRLGLQDAEVEARRQIRSRVFERHLNDGRTLEDLAVVDPFVRAVIDDTVAAAQITDRTFSKD